MNKNLKLPSQFYDKKLLAKIILSSVLISLGITSLFFAYNIISELFTQDWISDEVLEDPEIQQEFTDKISNLIWELIFGIGFNVWGGIMLKRIFFKSKGKKMKKESKKELKTETDGNKKNPKIPILVYVIFLPFVYMMLVLFSGSILNILNSGFEKPFFRFEDYFLYLMFIFVAISGKAYAWKWKKTNSQTYFNIFGDDYVIKERDILEKIRLWGFISLIIFVIILFVYAFTSNDVVPDTLNVYELALFMSTFGIVIITMLAATKITDDNKKREFRLLFASALLKRAPSMELELKIKYLTRALTFYSSFFKQNHKHRIKEPQKIIIEILSKGESEINMIINNFIRALKSGNDYAALNYISSIMKSRNSDLLSQDTLIVLMKEWGIFFATAIMVIFTALLLYGSLIFNSTANVGHQ